MFKKKSKLDPPPDLWNFSVRCFAKIHEYAFIYVNLQHTFFQKNINFWEYRCPLSGLIYNILNVIAKIAFKASNAKPFLLLKSPKHQHDTINHQEEPEDLMDTSSLSVEDIKIKKEQERANCYGFDVRILIQKSLFLSTFPASLSLIISFPQDDSDSD